MKLPRISFFSRLLDVLFPRLCTVCGNRLMVTEQVLCTTCNYHLPRTDFVRSPKDNYMARLLWGRIPIAHCAALFYYENHSQATRIIRDLKYNGHPEIGELMGQMTAEEFSCLSTSPDGRSASFFDGISLLIPVPLAKSRQRERGYNQSEEIARGVSRVTGLPVVTNAVRRISFHASQTSLGKWERNENVEKAFELVDASRIEGQHILLIDDVMTTGATMVACAKELLKARNVRLSVLTLGFAKG